MRRPNRVKNAWARVRGHSLLTFVLCGLLVGAACAKRDAEASGSTPITVGVALPLTGPVSYYGQDSKRGIELALEEINAQGGIHGRPVRVLYEDTQGNGTQALNAVRKLISIHNVPVIIGAGTSTETLAIASVVEQNQRVLISPVSSAAAISHAGEFVFRSVPSDGLQAVDLARWLVERNMREIGLIYVNQAWGVGLKNDFVREYTALGGRILGSPQATDLDAKDFRTQLTTLSTLEPQAVVALVYAKEGGLLVKQARELGIQQQIFGADPWTKHQFAEAAGPAAEGVLFTTPARYDGPEYRSFRERFRATYNADPGIYESHGYDCMKLVARAITAGGTTGPEIRAAMAATRGFHGVTGETTFDSNGDVTSKVFARMVWQGGVVHPASATR